MPRAQACLDIWTGHCSAKKPEGRNLPNDPVSNKNWLCFCENASDYHLAAAGSLLEIAMHAGSSLPVGKVDFLNLYPLFFGEFLGATGESKLAELISSGDWQMIDSFREKLIESLRYYYCVGGMPENVTTFVATRDVSQVRDFQKKLLDAYERDFSKCAKPDIVPRIRAVWNSLPTQLAREYENAIEWLCGAGTVA